MDFADTIDVTAFEGDTIDVTTFVLSNTRAKIASGLDANLPLQGSAVPV